MYSIYIVHILFIGCYGFTLPNNDTADTVSNKLPHEVLISYGDAEPVCGAALITDSVIITSASCIYRSFNSEEEFLKNAEVFGGGHTILYQLGNITNVTIHPGFNQNDFTNDIALAKVWKPLPKKRIVPIPLSSTWNSEDNCFISTWWNNKANQWDNLATRSIQLQKCWNKIEDDLICASTNSPNASQIYEQDIGSPIICDDKLTGVAVKFGQATNITAHYDWIKEAIRELGPLRDTSEILDPSTVHVLDRLDSQKVIKLLNELIELTKKQNLSQNPPRDDSDSYWNTQVVVPLNFIIFAMLIFLFITLLYHTLVNVALVHYSKK